MGSAGLGRGKMGEEGGVVLFSFDVLPWMKSMNLGSPQRLDCHVCFMVSVVDFLKLE